MAVKTEFMVFWVAVQCSAKKNINSILRIFRPNYETCS